MSTSQVRVTYAAPLIFLSSDQWTQIRAAISAQFPLRDVVWKPSSRPAVRTIAELNVELVGFDTIKEELASQIPQSLLEKPFLNVYIVTCDVSLFMATRGSLILCWLFRTRIRTKIPLKSKSRIGTRVLASARTRNG